MNKSLSKLIGNITEGMQAVVGLVFLSLVLFGAIANGTTTTTQTTLSTAQGATDTTVTLTTNTCASCTGGTVTARGSVGGVTTGIFIDGEYEEILTQVTGTTWTVNRGAQGSKRQAHNSGAVVWMGPPNGPFPKTAPSGGCTNFGGYNPQIPLSTGVPTSCISDQSGNYNFFGYAVLPPGTAGSATTVAAPGPFFHISGTTTVQTITPPPGFVSGCLAIVPDGAFATGTSGNIAVATTAVVSQTLFMCYDTNTAKFYPSYK